MIFNLKQGIRNRHIFLVDLLMICVSVLGAYILRLELGYTFHKYLPSAYWMMGISLVIKPLVYYLFGLYRRLWVYASVDDFKSILAAVTMACALVSGVMVMLGALHVFIGFPRLVIILDWILSIAAVSGVRFSTKLINLSQIRKNPNKLAPRKRALIVGAGDAGAIVSREIQKNPQLNVEAVGFLDDDEKKLNQTIYGVKVLGSIDQLGELIDQLHITDVFFAIPSAPGILLRNVSDTLREKKVILRTMPGIYELLGGKISFSKMRQVEITDLLRREPVKLDEDNITPILKNKVVMVTGAGGSIGRELSSQIALRNPSKLILLGHGENSIFETLTFLIETYPKIKFSAQIGDIRDIVRMDEIFNRFKPQVVFHAAAHKHVPLMETNVEEAVTNNIIGTRNIAQLARKYNVQKFVMISTDKAVRPINIMGATKRLAENLVLNESRRAKGTFTVVRFGNVLGSRGSVVPTFLRQISKGGPVTITDSNMRRYFMTIPEASYLVLEAAGLAKNQETFVLDMGEQVRIIELAEDLIRLSGLEPGRDIEIKFTGMRKGEKLSEDLWNEGQILEKTLHPGVYKLKRDDLLTDQRLDDLINRLLELARAGKYLDIRKLINRTIPDANLAETEPQEPIL